MTRAFRMTYLESILQRYYQAAKKLKSRMLDELCKVCGYNRKYAIRALAHLVRHGPSRPKAPPAPRRKRYGPRILGIIEAVWKAAYYPWSVRLREILKLWMPWIKKRFRLTPSEEKQLLTISPSTIDRTLRSKKTKLKRRLYGRTKPGTLLKHQIPIKTEHWDVHQPGFAETDTVSHSGNCAEGDFANSVNLTDIFSQWVETRAVMGKGEAAVFEALHEMRGELPFDLLGLDADNGSEFINHHLRRYCDKEHIQFTRSRPYKKDDNAHIEQKNYTHVRKLIGYDRYDSVEAINAMNDLYRNELRLWMNLFQPSVRLLKTVRHGSRVKRIYDAAKTPLDRLIASGKANRLKIAHLKAVRERTDPFELSRIIDAMLRRIWRLAHYRFPGSTPSKLSALAQSPELSPEEKRTVDKISKIFGVKSVQRTDRKSEA